MKYIPKVFLKFLLPDGSTREGFYRQSQVLADIIASFGMKGSTKLDQSKTIGGLGLKNDTIITVNSPT